MTRRTFVGETRAAATGLMAVVVAIMTLGGGALITDHVWLVDQRDTLKEASNASAIAATMELKRVLADDPDIGDDDLKAALKPVARGFVIANLQHLSEDRLARAKETLVVDVGVNRDDSTVGVDVRADLGGFLLSEAFGFLDPGPYEETKVTAGVEAQFAALSVVLAIDVSGSMRNNLAGDRVHNTHPEGRMNIVRQAARDLLDIVGPNDRAPVLVGVVPWSNKTCPGDYCRSRDPVSLDLTHARAEIEERLDTLVPRGVATASFAGVEGATEMLGDDEVKRALVLLTDGEDNHCGYSGTNEYGHLTIRDCPDDGKALRRAACDAAKAAGNLLFVVAAMDPDLIGSEFEDELRYCSSEGDGSGRYVFVNNATPEELRAAFADIANQLVAVRRLY